MPDGVLVQFPDDMPADQIRGMILKKFPDIAKKAAPETEAEDPGLLGSLTSGMGAAVREFGQTGTTLAGGKPKAVEEPTNQAAQGMEWGDVRHPKLLAEKALYGLGKGAPAIGGAVLGAYGGGAAGLALSAPVPHPLVKGIIAGGGALAGEALGSGLVSTAQSLGPYYAAALQKNPSNPDAAFDLALKQAETEGAGTGIAFAAFRIPFFKSQVKNILAQAFIAQPAIAAAGQVAQGAVSGEDVTAADLEKAYPQAVLGTAVPLVGTHLAGRAAGRFLPKREAPATKETPSTLEDVSGGVTGEDIATARETAPSAFRYDSDWYPNEEPSLFPGDLSSEGALRQEASVEPPVVKRSTATTGDLLEKQIEQRLKVGLIDEQQAKQVRDARAAGLKPFAAGTILEQLTAENEARGNTPKVDTTPTPLEQHAQDQAALARDQEELARMQAEEDLNNAKTAAEKQAAEAKLAELKKASEFESLSLEQGAEQPQASEANRRTVLLDTIQSVPTNNYNTLAANFSRALADQGFARVEPTEAELGTIKRAVDVQRAQPEVPPPAPPLEEIRTAPGGATELEAQIPELTPPSATPVQPSFEGMGRRGSVEPAAPEPVPAIQTITPELLDGLGVSPQAFIRKRVTGKDLNEPAVRQQFVDFANNQKVGQEARLNVARMLEGVPNEQMELFQPRRPAGETRVAGREPSVSDVGREAVRERATPEITGADRTRVGDVGAPVEPVGRGKDVQPDALKLVSTHEDAAARANEAFARGEITPFERGVFAELADKKLDTPENISAKLDERIAENKAAEPTTMGEPLRATGRRPSKERVFTGENARAEADAALKARGPQGITAERAQEAGNRSYTKLLQRGADDEALGIYDPLRKAIHVAMDSMGPLGTLNHEAIHAFRNLGLFKPAEWAALTKKATEEWIAKHEIEKKYAKDNLTPEQKIEEAVAEAYRDYAANRGQGGLPKVALDKIKNFLGSIKNWLRGRGFTTADKVFSNIESGKLGARERGAAPAGTGEAPPMQKISTRYTPEFDAQRKAMLPELQARMRQLGLHDVALKLPDYIKAESVEGGVKLQRAPKERVEEAQTARDKVRASRTAEQTVAGVKDMFKSRSVKGAIAVGAKAYKGMSPQGRRAWLWTLPTEDVFRNAKALVGDRIKNIDDLSAAFDGADALRNKLNFAGQKISNRLSEYQAKAKGSDFTNLEDVVIGSTLEQVDLYETMPKDASRSVRELHDVWKTLPTEARTLYKDIFDFFDTQKNEQFRLTLEDVRTSALPKELKEQAIKELEAQFKEIAKIKRYFPLSRPGKYWLRFGNGADYQMRKFETAMARNAAQDQYVEKLKAAGDKRDIDTLFADKEISTGDDMHSLRLELQDRPDTILNKVNKIIDKASDKNAKEEIADSVFQLYMDSLAGTDTARHWAPRSGDGTVGFSTDINRVFSARAMAGASHMARLAYHNRISNLIGGMYEAARGRADSDSLMPFIDTMAARAKRITDPITEDSIWDSIAQNGNKVVWVFMLTAPKSGVINITQVPVVAMPVMAASIKMPDGSQLGYARASAALTKNFATVFLTLDGKGFPNFKTIKERFATRENAAAPRLGEALGKIYEQFEEEGRFSTTFVSTMNSIARGPSPKYATDPWSKVGRGTTAALNWVTKFFQMTESRSRQLVAMTTAEIEYTNAIKSGKTHDEAVQIAKNSALKITGESMFNYSGVNRSELMTGGSGHGAAGAAAKTATQFSAFTTFFTSHIVRNAHTMFKGLDKAERKEAATKLFGTLGMLGMFGGVQGLGWLYGSIMGALNALGLTMNEEDDGDDSNPLLNKNADQWFKEHFLPTYFGPGSGLAKTFGLDKKSADALVSSIYSGPISALTGADFSSSVRMELPFQRALPFDSIFFSDDAPDITDRNMFEDAIFHLASGPSGGLITQMQSGIKDFYKGDFLRGAEQMVPAIARGPIRSMRFATEGDLTRQGAEIKGKEEFTPGMLLKQSIGFSDTRLDELQRATFLTNKARKQIDADREEVFDAFDRANRSGSESAFEKARKALTDFNAKNRRTPILAPQVRAGVLARATGRAGAISGVQPSKRFRGLTAEALSAYEDDEE
jgi:hypothetical protein